MNNELIYSCQQYKKKYYALFGQPPPEGLREVVNFLDYVRFKFPKKSPTTTPYRPIAFGGLWKDENIDDNDIDEVPHEMWQRLEDRQL